MNIKIKYFGQVAEIIGLNSEALEVDNSMNINLLKTDIENKYPALKKVDYKIAVNQEFVDASEIIKPNEEIALLPPFAGG